MKPYEPIESDRATSEEIQRARELYANDDLAIDDDALASRPEDCLEGDHVWVQAWVRIPNGSLGNEEGSE